MTVHPRTLSVLCLILATACASVAPTESGYLSSYEGLPESDSGWRVWQKSGVDWTGYDTAVIEPMAIRLQESTPDDLSEGQIESLSEWMDEHLHDAVAPWAEVVEDSDRGLRIRCALTEVDRSSLALNILTGILLIPVDLGGATAELEIVDATTGERLAAVVNADTGHLWNFIAGFSRIGHARQSLAETACWVGETIADAREPEPDRAE